MKNQDVYEPGHHTRIEQAETRSEQTIRASELSYRRLFEAAKDGILILDAGTGRISDVNPFLIALLGFSHREMIGKTIGELSPFKDMESNQAMLERLQKDGYVRYADLPLETKAGRKIAVEFVSNVYQAGDRNVIQCNVREITERKRAEATLRESEEQFRELMAHLQQVFWIKNAADTAVHYISPAYEKIWGYTRQSLYDNSHTFLDSIHPEDRERVAGEMVRKHETGGYDDEYRILQPDGQLRWIWARTIRCETSRARSSATRALPRTSPSGRQPRKNGHGWPQ